MRTKKWLFSLGLLILAMEVYADPIEDGKSIFTSRCAACHNVNKVLTGPALAGVDQRRSIDWIIKFVQSSQSVIKGGDKVAADLFQKFNKVVMPDHTDLTSDNIKSVVEYIKSQVATNGEKSPFVKPTKLMATYRPLSLSRDYILFIGYFIAVLLLAGILLLAVHSRSLQSKREKNSI